MRCMGATALRVRAGPSVPAGYLRTNPVATTTDRGAGAAAAIPLNT